MIIRPPTFHTRQIPMLELGLVLLDIIYLVANVFLYLEPILLMVEKCMTR